VDVPYKCPRGRSDCIALSNIISDGDDPSFFCCGEHSGSMTAVEQDKFVLCFKGEHDDRICCNDKRDLVHNAAVIMQALAVVEKAEEELQDWTFWK